MKHVEDKISGERHYNEILAEKIKALREKALKKRRTYSEEQLNKPVAFWISEDRLLNDKGKELTVILRTKGCQWALGETGGCSMCGYIQDAADKIDQDQIINQFAYAIDEKIEELNEDPADYILKIFNSGSFFDDCEMNDDLRKKIYQKIADINKIKEVVLESRAEFITPEKIAAVNEYLKDKYVEIGIGLETVNNYIRNNYINKSLTYEKFKQTFNNCKEQNIGVKAYLLFKPPFLNEQAAIDDCSYSITKLVDLGVNTISINPVNIQKGSYVEKLFYQNRYRPPWFYSLFDCLKSTLESINFKETRILSDPSGAGTKRGIHNCFRRECNQNMSKKLEEFVLTQDLKELDIGDHECECKNIYEFQKDFF
ncbi:MAG: hypothetical protein BAJALOKI2v1_360004 [Promethearchaeota archaeon]|nr:MAG: hypothetical protein BAJALOKI2v1_360004 [Candidatus Lokiarchaeota archaeon]